LRRDFLDIVVLARADHLVGHQLAHRRVRPRPLATPRTAMSRSVIIPISRSPSLTGIDPASSLSMKLAASLAVWSGRTV
jgi:hypothetical protein